MLKALRKQADRESSRSDPALVEAEQARIAPRAGGVDRDRTFGDEAEQVMRPARLRPRARQPLAAEGLRSHHRADHRAVDVEIADMRVRLGHLGGARDAAVEPHRQPEAFFIYAADSLDPLARRPGGGMEDPARKGGE